MKRSEKMQYVLNTLNQIPSKNVKGIIENIDPDNISEKDEVMLSMLKTIFETHEIKVTYLIERLNPDFPELDFLEGPEPWAKDLGKEELDGKRKEFKLCQEYVKELISG